MKECMAQRIKKKQCNFFTEAHSHIGNVSTIEIIFFSSSYYEQ